MKAPVIILIVLLTLYPPKAFSQVAINSDNSVPDSSAILDLKSSNRGFLPPRMTFNELGSILNPATGLMVYQTDQVSGLYINTGTASNPSWAYLGNPDIQKVLQQGNDAGGIPILNLPSPPSAGAATPKYYVDSLVSDCETRIPIDSAGYVISASGSYFLTCDIYQSAAATHGIRINCSSVSLDLNGFGIYGLGASSTANGIFVSGSRTDITIYNGRIRDWFGGISADNCTRAVIARISSVANLSVGVRVGSYSSVSNCRVDSNAIFGLFAYTASRVSDVIACYNGNCGIYLGTSGIIWDCVAYGNAEAGIETASQCKLLGCVSASNKYGFSIQSNCLVSGCVAANNNWRGISSTSVGCHIANCTVVSNGWSYPNLNNFTQLSSSSGIYVYQDSYVYNNQCNNNKGAGILVYGSDCVANENNVTNNAQFGLMLYQGKSLAIRNRASGNGFNPCWSGYSGAQYYMGTNNAYGPIVVLGTGSMASVTNSNHPMANFEY